MKLATRLGSSALAVVLAASTLGRAEPVQYCRFGHEAGQVDFCLGISTHRNSSTSKHDMYLSLAVTRDSELGWSAVGAGSLMAGALMFIVYGDPGDRGHAPVLSIRTVQGNDHHRPPRLVSRADMGGADLRVLQAQWMQTTPSAGHEQYALSASYRPQSARFSLVCYSCELWPGTPISPTSASQPWIWAWNDQQQFGVFSFDAELDMHRAGSGGGSGWGRFYMDMGRSLTQPGDYLPSFPPLRPNVVAVGASDTLTAMGIAGITSSASETWHKLFSATPPVLRAHGLLMASSFLLLFPAGVLTMRGGSHRAFTYHWMLQGLAATCVLVGAALGVVVVRAHGHRSSRGHAATGAHSHSHSHGKRHDESSSAAEAMFIAHQWLGGMVVGFVLLQIILGWWHHVIFVRIRTRTWVSYAHMWLGRTDMVAGCVNLLLGMALTGYNMVSIDAAAVLVVLEVFGVAFWLYHRRRIEASQALDKH
ncbi:hypothetical protein E4U42_004514 [Claviceps africana]|uniref:Cytochrome b561 domain-containing protein n=1 Tax=Claviceps africana TaxID=83212 RepID=A0A8K0JC28_9HYPO|nr:hypothetical protein E4U42_004514 [Claviceps africana]